MSRYTITKQQLIDWATNLQFDTIDVLDIKFFGGGVSTPGRVIGAYDVKFSAVEEGPENKIMALDFLNDKELGELSKQKELDRRLEGKPEMAEDFYCNPE